MPHRLGAEEGAVHQVLIRQDDSAEEFIASLRVRAQIDTPFIRALFWFCVFALSVPLIVSVFFATSAQVR